MKKRIHTAKQNGYFMRIHCTVLLLMNMLVVGEKANNF